MLPPARMSRLRPPAAALLFALLAVCAGCGSSASFTTRYASDFVHTPHTISVLGVYKDGRMNPDVWEQIGPGLCAPFGAACGPAYDTLISSNPNLSAAIDDYARANGIGDDLIDQLAPAATGDLIMVVTVAGRVGAKNSGLPDSSSVAGGPPSSIGSKYNRGGGSGMSRPTGTSPGSRRPRALADGAEFEMSASLFSVKQHRSVGMVAMEYSGPSVEDAVQRLAERLGVEIPGSKCGGWNWGVQVDDQHIRALIER
jgi:hypothetical protein